MVPLLEGLGGVGVERLEVIRIELLADLGLGTRSLVL
jgi:hypothetical protein